MEVYGAGEAGCYNGLGELWSYAGGLRVIYLAGGNLWGLYRAEAICLLYF